MKTQLLFYEKPYETKFTAEVTALETTQKGYRLALDRTLFYPEGGGQPADRGTISGIPVLHVEKKDGIVWHHLADLPAELDRLEGLDRPGGAVVTGVKTGAAGKVDCEIDWAYRFDYMQQHTGQHILSAVMYRDFSFNTVAVHQGEETTTIELDTGEMDETNIDAIENAAMEMIGRNLPVEAENVEEEKIENFDLRREPKVSGLIRVVSLGAYDSVACGGLHTATTGEVKLLKHVQTEKIRGNIRLHWKIGDRALRDYALKHGIVSSLVELYSAQPPSLLERVIASQEDLTATRRRANMLEGRLAGEIALRLFEEASRRQGGASAPPDSSEGTAGGTTNEPGPVIMTGDFEGEGKDFLKKIADGMPSDSGWLLAAVNRQIAAGDSQGGPFQWLIAASGEDVINFNRVKDDLLPIIDGKGGGRPPLWQGVGNKAGGIPDFFRKFRDIS